MTEKPVLGLRPKENVSPVRDRKDLFFILTQVHERRAVDIDKIRQDLIGAIGAEIPIEFLFATDLADLNWQQMYHPNALSAVYLGTRLKEISHLHFPDSEAIIAIHSDVDQRQIKVGNVSISCIVPDSQGRKRIVGISYDGQSFKASAVFVSIADSEKSKYPAHFHPDYSKEEDARLIKIPTAPADYSPPSTSVPLVSWLMSQISQGGTRMVWARAGKSWNIPFRDYFKDEDANNIAIGRGKTSNDFFWKVSFPASLIPVKSK